VQLLHACTAPRAFAADANSSLEKEKHNQSAVLLCRASRCAHVCLMNACTHSPQTLMCVHPGGPFWRIRMQPPPTPQQVS
jgi:hypothetical protein